MITFSAFQVIRKRTRFIRNMKKTCKKCGFRLLEMHRPFGSLLCENRKYTFALQANGVIYYGRIITGRSCKLLISDDGTCTRMRMVHTPTPLLATMPNSPFVQMVDRGNGVDRELFGFSSEFDYTFEADGKKVLIINPVPKRVVSIIEGHKNEMDNGDKVGEYTVYTGNAFLRSLERDYRNKVEKEI